MSEAASFLRSSMIHGCPLRPHGVFSVKLNNGSSVWITQARLFSGYLKSYRNLQCHSKHIDFTAATRFEPQPRHNQAALGALSVLSSRPCGAALEPLRPDLSSRAVHVAMSRRIGSSCPSLSFFLLLSSLFYPPRHACNTCRKKVVLIHNNCELACKVEPTENLKFLVGI
ncbi:hypothetical protein Peur_049692 [Populus x canadensis]